MGPPPELNSIRFLKRGINYSASRANENDMWDPSATPQDPDMLVHKLEGSVAQNFRPADACQRHFMRGLASLELLVLDTHGTDSEAPHLAL